MDKMFGKSYENWLDGYLNEGDPKQRLRFLEAVLSDADTKENHFRQQLFDYRYRNANGEITGVDKFMAAWMELKDLKRISKQLLGAKRAIKSAESIADSFMLTAPLEDWQKQILREEHKHLINHYVSLCQNDRTYTSHILGFMNMKESQLVDKLKTDIYETAVEAPEIVGMSETFAPISDIVKNMM